jgi:hypothetical protein
MRASVAGRGSDENALLFREMQHRQEALELAGRGRLNLVSLPVGRWRTTTAIAPETCRVRVFLPIAALLAATQLAAAQDAAQPAAKRINGGHSMPLRLVPAHLPRPRPPGAPPVQFSPPAALPGGVPEQFSPPQEAYAAFPDAAGAAPGQLTPSACQARLDKLAVFKPLPVLAGAGECGAVDAVLLESVILSDLSKVAVSPPATLRCTMAEAVAVWLREDVAPAALKLGAALRGLDNFDSYECRGRNRVRGATLSEHGRANALDVRAFKLANGEEIGLTDVNIAKDWREAVRASACARFSTVLGPGSDGNHEEHIHVDLAERHGGYKMCEWEVRQPVMQAERTVPDTDEHTSALSEPVPLPRPRPAIANADDANPPSKKARLQLR